MFGAIVFCILVIYGVYAAVSWRTWPKVHADEWLPQSLREMEQATVLEAKWEFIAMTVLTVGVIIMGSVVYASAT